MGNSPNEWVDIKSDVLNAHNILFKKDLVLMGHMCRGRTPPDHSRLK